MALLITIRILGENIIENPIIKQNGEIIVYQPYSLCKSVFIG